MRMLANGKIVRKLEGSLGERAMDKAQQKILAAALEILKEEDENLGQIVGAALDDAVKRTREAVAASDKSHAAAVSRIIEAVGNVKFDDAALKEIISGVKDAQKESSRAMADVHRQLGADIRDLAVQLSAAIRAAKPAEAPKAEPQITKWRHKIVGRSADGKAKEIESVAADA